MGNYPSTQPGGFRILKITPGSPADQAKLEIFFDFIVELEDHDLTFYQPEGNQVFADLLQKTQGDLHFVIYNTRTRTYRDTYVKPIQKQGKKFLGASIQHEPFSNASTQGVRILAVHQNSPAEQAGLSSYKDYLISSDNGPLTGYEELSDLTTDYLNQSMTLMVYNSSKENIRSIEIKPNLSWGGKTCLGCDVAVGYLNQIPLSRSASISEIDIVNKLPRSKEPSQMEHWTSQHNMANKISVDFDENTHDESRISFPKPIPNSVLFTEEHITEQISDKSSPFTVEESPSINQERAKTNNSNASTLNQERTANDNNVSTLNKERTKADDSNASTLNQENDNLDTDLGEIGFSFERNQEMKKESDMNEPSIPSDQIQESNTASAYPELDSGPENQKLDLGYQGQ